MDTLRGNFTDRDDLIGVDDGYNPAEDDTGHEAPPDIIGQDERRMQVRAYNHWAGLLEDRNFPSIDDLDPAALSDFGPYSVLLDFTAGVENPGVSFLGDELARECGMVDEINQLSDVPNRSLLSRITDHYMQILANQAPIGFEAEFVNLRGQTILYRGILLPFSSDDDTIDFIYGVINWKELADQRTTDELMLEIDQALEEEFDPSPIRSADEPITDWADGPASNAELPDAPGDQPSFEDVIDLAAPGDLPVADESVLPMPQFGNVADAGFSLVPDDLPPATQAELPGIAFEAAAADDFAAFELDDSEMELGDWLASARELAQVALSNEDRSRAALYDAISRAYDFSLAAAAEPEEFTELVTASGLAVQERAPMTPVVKLVFGSHYDKTRLTEYAAALAHAHRLGVARGAFGNVLRQAEGGLKGVVKAERALRREESGKSAAEPSQDPRAWIAEKLRKIAPMGFEDIAEEGPEFGIVVIRRFPSGEIAMLGEISDDVPLVERAAKKLLG